MFLNIFINHLNQGSPTPRQWPLDLEPVPSCQSGRWAHACVPTCVCTICKSGGCLCLPLVQLHACPLLTQNHSLSPPSQLVYKARKIGKHWFKWFFLLFQLCLYFSRYLKDSSLGCWGEGINLIPFLKVGFQLLPLFKITFFS